MPNDVIAIARLNASIKLAKLRWFAQGPLNRMTELFHTRIINTIVNTIVSHSNNR
jgi:hypothetical protein